MPRAGRELTGRPVTDDKGSRFWDVDALRGVAIMMVVLYHLVYDLDNFGGYPIESTAGFWALFADASAFLFVFLVGLSLTLSYSRTSATQRPTGTLFGKYVRRGLRIFAYGMVITLVFRLLDYGYVIFGILHLIGASIVLAYPFLRLRWANLVLGLLIIALGAWVGARDLAAGGIAGVLLAPLGVLPEGLMMPDYRPLLPWFGVVLLGVFAGNAAYLPWRERHRAGEPPGRAVSGLAFIGRNTLFIYLAHQPVLIAALWALGILTPPGVRG